VEQDKIKIRVGGNYLAIDDFIDSYTPGQERRDPFKKLPALKENH
jgi:hypothetical protein